MTGYSDGTFKPDAPVTLNEVKAIVIKYVAVMQKTHGSYKNVMCSKCRTNFHFDEFNKFLKGQKMTGSTRAYTSTVLSRAEIIKVMNRLFVRGPLTQVKLKNWSDVPTSHWAYLEIQEASRDHEAKRLKNDQE
jgi:hypothetical protein